MLSQGSIHFRQELINLISYVNRGGYRAMSECSKYQLLLQTDYVRLREKYDHLYIYLHILSYIALRESSQLFFFETKDSCPVECSDGCCKTIAACKTMVDRNSTGFYC
jgi:hypothetical protein